MANEEALWYLSFVGEEGFRGGVCIEGESFEAAYFNAVIRKINPGGEVMGVPFPNEHRPPDEFIGRLLTKQDVDSMSIECPVCHRISYNRNDIENGYCGNCHRFTSKGTHG